jgi:Fur family transcriptional regulator, ferric uptake regulator
MLDETQLRQNGIRLTPQRRMILAAITSSQGHLTAEEILQRIVPLYPDMNISTVYRNLERLLELRLLAVTDLGGGSVRYEVVGEQRHHHLICSSCGSMVELRDDLLEGLRSSIMQECGFQTAIDHLALWGLCADCRKGGISTEGE